MALVKPLHFDEVEETLAALDGATDSIELNGLSLTGDVQLNGNQILGASDNPAATGVPSREWVERLVGNVRWKGSVRAATAAPLPPYTASGSGIGKTLDADGPGALGVDDVAVDPGDYVLVKSEAAAHLDHGIYLVLDVDPFSLVRATYFDGSPDGEISPGSIVHVLEGTENERALWALVTPDPIVDVTPFQFADLKGPVSNVGGDGIDITASLVRVDLAVDSGLGFSSGKLEVELDGGTLGVSALGLSALGVPSEFEVGGIPTGVNVTAASLTALTDGSNADAYHSHTTDVDSFITETPISAGDPFYFTPTGDRIGRANIERTAPLVEKRVCGVARTSGAVGDVVEVIMSGVAAAVLAGATPSSSVWAAPGGGYQFSVPTGSRDRKVLIGNAISATDLCVRVQDYGRRA